MDHTKLGAEKMAGAEFCSEPIYEKRILFISSRSIYIYAAPVVSSRKWLFSLAFRLT